MGSRAVWSAFGMLVLGLACLCNPGRVAAQQSDSTSASTESIRELQDAGLTLAIDDKTASITEVDASKVRLTLSLASQLAKITQNGSIRKLTVRQVEPGAFPSEFLDALVALEQFDGREATLENEVLQRLLAASPKLKAIRLSNKSGVCAVDDAAFETLSNCRNLKVFAADYLPITDKTIDQAVRCPQLSELYAAYTKVSPEAGRELAKASKLTKLRLAGTAIDARSLAAIAHLKLTELDVSECADVGVGALPSITMMTSLQKLNLWSTSVPADDIPMLAELTELNWLNLDNTAANDVGVATLATLPKLAFLHLGSTKITNDCMESLALCKSLKKLIVTRTAVTEEGVTKLAALRPDMEVQLVYVPGK